MKKNTALFMAILMIVSIVAGGSVFLSIDANAASSSVPVLLPKESPGIAVYYHSAEHREVYRFQTSNFDNSLWWFTYLDGSSYVQVYVSDINGCSWGGTGSGGHTSIAYDNLYYYASYGPDSNINNPICVMASFEDGMNAIINYRLNSYTFTLQAGSVAYIEYSNQDIDLQMNTVMPELSITWIAGNQPDFWPASQTYIGNVNSLPVLNDTFNYSNWNRIEWNRGEPRNILGQTKNAVYSDTVFYGGNKYLTIYNYPYYLTNLDKAEVELSGSINIEVTNAVSITVYTVLSGTINGVSGSVISNSGNNVSTDGQYTDQNGQIVNPTTGSGNYIPENTDLESVLSDLVSDIDAFFTGTWRHIRQLVTSAGKLPSVIVEMYSWLPEEYKAVLFSAFGIVIVVGILKVML